MAAFLSSTSTSTFRRRSSATPPPLSISNPSSSSSICTPCRLNNFVVGRINNTTTTTNKVSSLIIVKCESSSSSHKKLEIGSPIIMVEAPIMLKTAASVPCLRSNSGLVKAGDVGRIVSRKPKDVWAVRLTNGTYLIDGRYFKPLELDV